MACFRNSDESLCTWAVPSSSTSWSYRCSTAVSLSNIRHNQTRHELNAELAEFAEPGLLCVLCGLCVCSSASRYGRQKCNLVALAQNLIHPRVIRVDGG